MPLQHPGKPYPIRDPGLRGESLCCVQHPLVRADDLSQVKRAFDLNGFVGILYLIVLAVSIYAG